MTESPYMFYTPTTIAMRDVQFIDVSEVNSENKIRE